MYIFNLIEMAYRAKASDLHLSSGKPPYMRVQGRLMPMDYTFISVQEMELFLAQILKQKEREDVQRGKETDLSLVHPEGIRLRLHIYSQQGLPSISIRLFPKEIPLPQDLRLPPILLDLICEEHGLILVTGPTGSGKTTTLASLIHYLNQQETLRIITLEDPVEYIHTPICSMIEQREIGLDTDSFLAGIRSALRQDPDVILIGELRDRETMQAAIRAAEAGRLVLATVHTSRAVSAIYRLIDAFPPVQQSQIRSQLALNLLAVTSQRLLPLSHSPYERIAAVEVLINTSAVSHLIRTDQLHQIESVMQAGRNYGMQSLEMAYQQLQEEGWIDPGIVVGKKSKAGLELHER
ncbi:type IV pilus twitching motility protein PilT [Thermoflavimicrobium dichotomicum]|uniref:Twitching motility protein PilT n=1 Tax=Thermoflavimicrobium dichotomicum TaxID=46223 RepID=A0A1I3R7S5_9BACL|nr:PilT/PilU family type 4a pilus ATPase [Thermoflavimicrobium dichotomicum]SFJ42080.1 twitching motility protein PilT [Thermoflavimicrobium dichotomicum]